MLLLNRQKTKLFELIEEAGFSPKNFAYEEKGGHIGRDYLNTAYITSSVKDYCQFIIQKEDDIQYNIRFSPGDNIMSENHEKIEWYVVLKKFKDWLKLFELELEDKWTRLNEYSKQFDNDEIDNTPFTVEEKREINFLTEKLKKDIYKSKTIDKETIKRIEHKIDYVVSKVDTLGRIDWKNIFIGALVSMFMTPDNFTVVSGYLKEFIMGFKTKLLE